ncbi:glycoside hydrolase family 2 TIM barrel-domain containing protein [Tamlana sp. 2_MG-2023]|uniref:glycoside hydrolase family 2 TIM barrel-domain containing protein n=1 Tax=unclassified Tamlana TaxID=2614803 RepID=UPI0026E35765|nr:MULTISPECIES: glycoside hydrolase family 2 TIM barrel-domain containing protein [unclassified Tamlana]MDO6761284.1 glycoside hydrolase family 2 TIM barrel-domain containing protein [Tamlana sp. 2_MG-2023]MDO6791767.1 glycoside hydrolase family 2 TIM barrel-domain containing protein [Tamlana sp. 1_MG-2023]
MPLKTTTKPFTIFLFALFMHLNVVAQEREKDFNFDWKFTLVEDTKIPTQLPLDDSTWRDVRLPHDWSVEASFSDTWDGATGYLPGGVGVYQKHFKTTKNPENGKTYILFDGVYNNATFWLNGKLLGENPYGYSPVYFDLSDKLKTDGSNNVITVHVDHSRYVDSRWYTGSGIYRNVKLITTDNLHIPIWGTYVTTPEISKEQASIQVETTIKNSYEKNKKVTLKTEVFDTAGKRVAVTKSDLKIASKKTSKVSQTLSVSNPLLWEPDNPIMYKAVSSVIIKNKVVDVYETPFGIRDIVFKAKEGFFLNGKSTFMKGVCLHHDGGLVGSAVPKGVWRRRLQLLKDGGVNAIRTSHNPFSQEFLDLCDEMGFLVQNEIFDEFDYPKDKRQNYHDRHDDYISRGYDQHFQKWGKSDLTRSILRDRNHPSVVQWSIGNEIEWTYLNYRYSTGFWKDPENPQDAGEFWGKTPMYSPEELKKRYEASNKGKYILAETAKRLNGWVKDLDTTRPTTANLIIPQISHVSGYADAVDLVGYSYRNIEIPWAQTHFPEKQVTINECPGAWDDWKQVLEYPGVFSMFMWTGIDYLGESYERWPGRRPWGDMLDLAGFKLQGYNYFKSIWKEDPHLSIGTLPIAESGFTVDSLSGFAVAEKKASYKWRDSNMHWNYKENDTILVEVCSNYATVELLLNGKSLGFRSMSESPDRLMRWVVPFQSGKLEARAVLGREKMDTALQTTSKPVRLAFNVDKTKLKADAYDVAHLVVQLEDENGLPVKTENTKVEFTIEGNAKLLGVDSANFNKHQDFQSNSIETFRGRALAIIQSTKNAGTVSITARAEGYASKTIKLTIK